MSSISEDKFPSKKKEDYKVIFNKLMKDYPLYKTNNIKKHVLAHETIKDWVHNHGYDIANFFLEDPSDIDKTNKLLDMLESSKINNLGDLHEIGKNFDRWWKDN